MKSVNCCALSPGKVAIMSGAGDEIDACLVLPVKEAIELAQGLIRAADVASRPGLHGLVGPALSAELVARHMRAADLARVITAWCETHLPVSAATPTPSTTLERP